MTEKQALRSVVATIIREHDCRANFVPESILDAVARYETQFGSVSAENSEKRKRAPGGGRKALPKGERQHRRTIRMDDGRWSWCQEQGDASKYIRGLIDADRRYREANPPT